MTESAQCAAYNIGIAQDDSLELVSEAARRLAAVTVPLLCGLVVLHAMKYEGGGGGLMNMTN